MANNQKKNKKKNKPMTIEKFFKSNNLEIVTAALLLSGKLRVNSVQLARSGTLSVILFGEFLEELGTMFDVDQTELEKLFENRN